MKRLMKNTLSISIIMILSCCEAIARDDEMTILELPYCDDCFCIEEKESLNCYFHSKEKGIENFFTKVKTKVRK